MYLFMHKLKVVHFQKYDLEVPLKLKINVIFVSTA